MADLTERAQARHTTPIDRTTAAPTPRAINPWRAMPVLLAGTVLIVLDFFIVNVALPSLQTDLHAGPTALEWVVAGYGLTLATFLLAAGRLGDRFGRRRMLAGGIALFTLASAGCGFAPNPDVLVAARLVQGLGAAMTSPNVLGLIGTLFTAEERPKAIGLYATVMGVAAASGQLVGGVLLHADIAGLGWRLVFLVNLPIGAIALTLIRRTVPESKVDNAARFDITGLGLLTAALTALVLPLLTGQSEGWPAWTIITLAAAPLLVAGFATHQNRTARHGGAPLLDPTTLRDRNLRAGLIVQLGFWIGQASYFLVLALYLQLGRGLSALQSGLVFTILAVAYLGASMKAPALAARVGGATTIAAGAGALAVGHVLAITAAIGAGSEHGIGLLTPGLALEGVGMGLCIGPITTTVLSRIAPHQAGTASGLLSTVQQVANATGVALIGLVFFHEARASSYAHAFELSLTLLAGLLAVVGILTTATLGKRAHRVD
jgi:EmrB/QacA subfamily drug resistance transporter